MIRPLFAAAILLGQAWPLSAQLTNVELTLAKRLEGLAPGKPVSCVSARQLRESTTIPGTAIVYETTGARVYVNRPRGDLRGLTADRIIVVRSSGGQLCEGDVVDLASRTDGQADSSVTLGAFTPYDRWRDVR